MSQELMNDEPDYVAQLRTVLEGQHAVHGIMGRTFEKLEAKSVAETGEGFVYNWAEQNPGRFITLICKMTPTLAPVSGMHGDINLTVNNNLITTALDD